MFSSAHNCFSYLSSFFLIISLPLSLSFYLTDSNPLLSFNSQVREVHLYTGIYDCIFFSKLLIDSVQIWKYCCRYSLTSCTLADNHRRGMYLQMSLDGRVSGSDAKTLNSEYLVEMWETDSIWGPNLECFLFKNIYACNGQLEALKLHLKNLPKSCKEDALIYVSVFSGVLQLKSINPGHIIIKGRSSSLYLCIDSEGHLRGQVKWAKVKLQVCVPFFVLCWQFTSVLTFRGTTQRLTATSESCCCQMDTPVSFPHTMDFPCLWHQNNPKTDPQSPSLDSSLSGIPWQRRVCLNNQTIRDISTWTLMICWEWV